MGQLGFFDAEKRLAALSEKGDPLETIAGLVPWESFRANIEAVVLTPEEAKKSKAGRKPLDALVLFRMLVLQALYNLSDEQIEYQVCDRATFMRFVGLGSEDGIPDGTTLWLFREKLARAGLIEKLFDRFDQHLNAKGYIARGGQMVDRQHCACAEAAQHARGERGRRARRDAGGVGAKAGEEPPER
jgi:transposase, IS5 family